MTIISNQTFYHLKDLQKHLQSHEPSFYFSSKTSTVINYDHLEKALSLKDYSRFSLCDLAKMPPSMKILENGNLIVRGGVTWKDARDFLSQHNRALKTSPTEQLAIILAGVSTSCTGERCFKFGNLRSQVVRIQYLNSNGEEKELLRNRSLENHAFFQDTSSQKLLLQYQEEFSHYKNFKNAPYPRLEQETDLMIGTEGQLGVITEVELETAPLIPVTYVFLLLPRWEDDFSAHLEVFYALQDQRHDIFSFELLDSNCMNYLDDELKIGDQQDILILEVASDKFEKVYEEKLSTLKSISEEDIFEIPERKFHQIRAGVPRALFEENSKRGVTKMGTDIQVTPEKFEDLLVAYQKLSKLGIPYCLFGHFGDAHLHFNFMPDPKDAAQCLQHFESLYQDVLSWRGSPFAEHGIGLIKQKYIKIFHGKTQKMMFSHLKKSADPWVQFFPQGFMK